MAALLGILSLEPTAAQAPDDRDPEAVAAYNAGLENLKQEKWEDAITSFSNAIAIDPMFAEALVGHGDALREIEDYNAALQSYLQATRIYDAGGPSPEAALAYNGRGVCYRELGDINLALVDFDTAAQMDRKNAEIAANYGDLLVNQVGDATKALHYLDQAIELDPENPKAYRNRGLAHAQLQEFDEATLDLTKSIELDPETYETYTTLAAIYVAQEEYEPAIEAFSKAIEHYKPEESSDPKIYVEGYLRRSNSLYQFALQEDISPEKRKSLLEAVLADTDQVLEEYSDRPESGLALRQRGLALRMLQRYSEAIKALTDAIQLGGSDSSYLADAYLKRGICWHYQGQDSLARGDFEQAATINFEDPLPHLWIGFTHAQEEDYREAIESYGEAISKNPSFPAPYVNRGLAYMQLGEYEKAVDNFNEAIRNEPTEAEHFYKRGIAYLKLEEYQKALDSFDLAILNEATSAKAYRGAAIALHELGRDNLAKQYENRAKSLAPAS